MNKNKLLHNIIYISYDGILEPIGQSQIVPYLLKLSKKYNINIISFEKNNDLKNLKLKSKIQKKLSTNKINWKFLRYNRNIFLLFYSLIKAFFLLLLITLTKKIKFFHIRSYMPGLIIIFFNIFFKVNFIFDMRGFWIDEKVDRSNLSKNGFKYRFFKIFEKYLLSKSKNIITLTNESKNILIKNFSGIDKNKISVIPTCVQTDVFYSKSFNLKKNNKLIFCHLGSIDTAYDLKKVINLFKNFLEINNKIFLKIVTNIKKEKVLKIIYSLNLKNNYYTVVNANHHEINKILNQCHIGIFYAKNNYSIKASFPTKIGEYFSCGKPIICNNFNKDINNIITKNNLGIISNFTKRNSSKDYSKLKKLLLDKELKKRLSTYVNNNLSVEIASMRYLNIYDQL